MRKHSTLVSRILMTTDCIGGVWNYSIQLARALSSFEIKVFLATMGGPPTDAQLAEVSAIRNVELFQSTYKLEWMVDPWGDVEKAGDWLLGLEKDLRPDLVHLNGYAHGSLPWRPPILVVGHSCVYSWFRAVRRCDPPPQWERYRKVTAAGLHAADAVTAPTTAMLRCLKEIYGPFNSCGAIYNGRGRADFVPDEKEPVIFSAGRLWDEAKNTAALNAAAGHLSWPVYVAGETTHPDGGACHYANVNHLGHISVRDMAEWLGRASIYVLPARYEPFGLTALEAALAGCALVLGNIPTLREIWADAALYVPPDRPEILTSVLQELISQREQIARLSRKARSRALRYTPERMAREYVELYEKVLADRRDGRPTLNAQHRTSNG